MLTRQSQGLPMVYRSSSPSSSASTTDEDYAFQTRIGSLPQHLRLLRHVRLGG
jgi:hypothetical protein